MNGSFGLPGFDDDGIDAAFRDVYGKICGFFPVSLINRGSVRRFDLHIQSAFLRFQTNLKRITFVQLQRVQIRPVHSINVQQIGVRIFDAAACEALLIGTEQEYGSPCKEQQGKYDQENKFAFFHCFVTFLL